MSSQPDAVASLNAEHKAEVLIQALPWLREFAGEIVVVKYGGNAMIDDTLKSSFAQDIVFLHSVGLRPVVVHGGGPQISAMLERLDIPSEFNAGVRVTSPEVAEVVRMVLTGQVQRELVNLINAHGPLAVGVSGEDASMFDVSRHEPVVDGESIDVGQVGQVNDVRTELVDALLADGLIPVVSSIAADADGVVYNVNADTAAGALAQALAARKLVVMTDVAGVMPGWPEDQTVASELTVAELDELLPTLSGGMIPKLQACRAAVAGGVQQAHVIDGRMLHSMLLEVFTDTGIGTMIIPSPGSSS